MANNDYKELVDFLGNQLEQIHNEIAQVNTNLENKLNQFNTNLENKINQFNDNLEEKIISSKEEAMRHTGVLIEEVNHKLDLVIEGLTGTQEGRKQDNIINEQEHVQIDKRILINAADISSLDQRVGRLESKF